MVCSEPTNPEGNVHSRILEKRRKFVKSDEGITLQQADVVRRLYPDTTAKELQSGKMPETVKKPPVKNNSISSSQNPPGETKAGKE